MLAIALALLTTIAHANTANSDNTAVQSPNASPPMSTGGATAAGPTMSPDSLLLRRTLPSHPETEMLRSTATEITFQSGTANLTPESQAALEKTIQDAHKRGQIDQVKVLSWGDISYPPTGAASAPKGQKDLAKKRNQAIEQFIEKSHKNLYVETYNMAERPSALQDLLNTSEARVKESLEKSGLSGKENRGSRAMMMVILR